MIYRKIEVIDSLSDIDGSGIECKTKMFKGKLETFYKVYLYLDGLDLPFVKKVSYKLHNSFRRPNIEVIRSLKNQHLMIEFWTHGIFTVDIKVTFSDDSSGVIKHKLIFFKELAK